MMKRRSFLQLSTAAGLGAYFGAPMLGNAFSQSELDGGNFDYLCIGTGYGSAVTALRLAEAGKKVLMLEMGLDWENTDYKFSGMAWATKESTWLRSTSVAPFANYRWLPKFTGVLDREDFENVSIWQGKGVGGGSLANGGMAVTPKKEYFAEIFPELDTEEFYSTYFPRANDGLGVTTIPEDFYQSTEYYQFSRVGEEEARNCGYKTKRVPNVYDFDYMKKEADGTATKSALGGEVIYGNNHGKKSLTKTYIKEALATNNVTILGLHRADQIVDNGNGTFTVFVSVIDTKGRTTDTKAYTTGHLFLGCGSIGTTKLLLKSNAKGTLPNLEDTVGKYWGNNGNAMCGRRATGKKYGAKQSGIPCAGVDAWTKNDDAIFGEIAPFPLGLEIDTALYLVINRVPKLGEIVWNATEDKINLKWDSSNNAHMIRNAGNFIDKMSEVNGGKRTGLLPNGIDPKICYHPLGGVVLNRATNEFGKLNNHDGIYIVDGALVPGTIGVNPFVTITAIAEYCIENNLRTEFNNNDGEGVTTVENLNLIATPNPFDTFINVEFDSPINTTAKLSIINWAGRVVGETTTNATTGKNTFNWSGLGYLWKEHYVLRLEVGNLVETAKVQKSWR